MSQQLSLRIHSVKCIDETNGAWAERFGNDEIWLGGYTIAANGSTQVIAPWSVYAGFDDGDIKVFDPPRVMHSFALGAPGAPGAQEFGIGLVLVEKDNGGMGAAITAIAKLVQEQLQAQLAAAKAARTLPSTAAGLAVEVLKWLLAATGPAILREVKRRIMAAYDDDVFQPQHLTQLVRGLNFSFSGSNTSARKTLRFQDHDGIYELVCDWQVTGQATTVG